LPEAVNIVALSKNNPIVPRFLTARGPRTRIRAARFDRRASA
jgi:hypothetical protein